MATTKAPNDSARPDRVRDAKSRGLAGRVRSRRPQTPRDRLRYAFIRTYKPVMDDAPFRAFDTMADYRRWCEENLPDWLGYGRI